MRTKCVIQWKSNVNGSAGRGTKLFERDEAERLAEELNDEYPQIEHEVAEIPPAEPEPAKEQAPTLSIVSVSDPPLFSGSREIHPVSSR